MRTRIAAGDRRDVDQVASGRLVEPGALEPAEERAARAPGERLAAGGLRLSRRLADEHRARRARRARRSGRSPARGRSDDRRRDARSVRRARRRATEACGGGCEASSSLPRGPVRVPRVGEAIRRAQDAAIGDERRHERGGRDVECGVVAPRRRSARRATRSRARARPRRGARSRSASPVGVAGSNVLHGAAT